MYVCIVVCCSNLTNNVSCKFVSFKCMDKMEYYCVVEHSKVSVHVILQCLQGGERMNDDETSTQIDICLV